MASLKSSRMRCTPLRNLMILSTALTVCGSVWASYEEPNEDFVQEQQKPKQPLSSLNSFAVDLKASLPCVEDTGVFFTIPRNF